MFFVIWFLGFLFCFLCLGFFWFGFGGLAFNFFEVF